MFRLATCDDLIKLKIKYQDLGFTGIHGWGLKQMGNLFCVDSIRQLNSSKVLEVGGGLNLFFDEDSHRNNYEYWMIDKIGFYDKQKFEESLNKRKNTKFVNDLLGNFSTDLPSNYFDLCFSISVLEHSPTEKIKEIVEDMYRVVKPGGYIAHTIDVNYQQKNMLGKLYEKYIKDVGFIFKETPELDFEHDLSDADIFQPTLFEPLQIVYEYYFTAKSKWHKPIPISSHFSSVLVLAKKLD